MNRTATAIEALLSDPTRPVGLPDVAAVTDPLIPLTAWGAWARRGHLPEARWTVSRLPAWSALDLLTWLSDTPVHVRDGRAVRCGRTCPYCSTSTPVSALEALRSTSVEVPAG